ERPAKAGPYDRPAKAGPYDRPAKAGPYEGEWPEFACPECRGALARGERRFTCNSCHLVFPYENGIARFLTVERLRRAERFQLQYRRVRQRDGHGQRSADEYGELPLVSR